MVDQLSEAGECITKLWIILNLGFETKFNW